MIDALRSRAATVRIVLASLALVAGMFVFVFPTRTWWSARQQVSSARSQLAQLEQQNKRLERQATQLQDDATIERLARAEFGYVLPGEQAYTAIPTPPTTTTTVPAAPAPTGAAPPPSTTPTTAAKSSTRSKHSSHPSH